MKIRIKEDCDKTPPDAYCVREFKASEIVRVHFGTSEYPGKPFVEGSLRWTYESIQQKTLTPTHDMWEFWTTDDIEDASLFLADEIDQLYVTKTEYEQLTPQAINSAPFEIILEK